MAKITIREGWNDCETCGSYGWLEVTAPELNYAASGDAHLGEFKSVEECLIEILEKLGHEVEFIGDNDG